MKISDVVGKAIFERDVAGAREAGAGGAVEFQNMLNEEIEGAAISEGGVDDVQSPGALVSELAPPALDNDLSTVGKENMSRISGMVGDALGRIEDAVGEQSQDLKALEGVIDSLSKEADNLKDSTSDLPRSHGLRQIADELGVLAYVESVKWKRGDYL